MRNIAPPRISRAIATSMQRWITRLCLCAPLLLAGASGHAETYFKWKNDNGSWEYGAHPPPGKHAIEIRTTVTKALEVNAGADGTDGTETSGPARGTLEMEFEQKQKASKKKNAEYCLTARSNLEALGSKAVIRRRDAEGNVTVVSEEERKQEMEKAEVAIERYCD